MKSLRARKHELSAPLVQIGLIERGVDDLPGFDQTLTQVDWYPLTADRLEILQVNVGKMCNQTCAHCHVDAGPDRDEIMTRETMELCLQALDSSPETTVVDITGGAPEMNPHLRWFVEEVSRRKRQVLVRSNLTILTTAPKYQEFPEFFAGHGVGVVSSLPCYTAENTDRQRGDGVFDRSIEALRMLNQVGYGDPGSALELDLVYNPVGPSLPPAQQQLEADYKRILMEQFGIRFNRLFCITNMPISRFLEDLLQTGRYEEYMQRLVDAFNPAAVQGVMCRNTLSVGWDGTLYDCDFNQMLEMGLHSDCPAHIRHFDSKLLSRRKIVTNQHCYGCTAGAGSSCQGEIDS